MMRLSVKVPIMKKYYALSSENCIRMYILGAIDDFMRLLHRLQLSRNLRDSPGFVEFVPGPGQSYYRSIVCPGSGAAPIKAIARTCKFVSRSSKLTVVALLQLLSSVKPHSHHV